MVARTRDIDRTVPVSVVALAVVSVLAACAPAGAPVGKPPSPRPNRAALDREFRELVDTYNRETGARQLSAGELRRLLEREGSDLVLLDIREPEEHEVSAVPGARLLPPGDVPEAAIAAPEGATVVTYCTAGYRSGLAAVQLERRLGRPVYNLDGGIIAWFNAGGEVTDPAGRPVDRIHPYGERWARYIHPRPGSEDESEDEQRDS